MMPHSAHSNRVPKMSRFFIFAHLFSPLLCAFGSASAAAGGAVSDRFPPSVSESEKGLGLRWRRSTMARSAQLGSGQRRVAVGASLCLDPRAALELKPEIAYATWECVAGGNT